MVENFVPNDKQKEYLEKARQEIAERIQAVEEDSIENSPDSYQNYLVKVHGKHAPYEELAELGIPVTEYVNLELELAPQEVRRLYISTFVILGVITHKEGLSFMDKYGLDFS